jgi:hypothetical protein
MNEEAGKEIPGMSVDDFEKVPKKRGRKPKVISTVEPSKWVDGGSMNPKTGEVTPPKKPRKPRGPNKVKRIKKVKRVVRRKKGNKKVQSIIAWVKSILSGKKSKKVKKGKKRAKVFVLTITLKIK